MIKDVEPQQQLDAVAMAKQITDKAAADLAGLLEKIPVLEARLLAIAEERAQIAHTREGADSGLQEMRRIRDTAQQEHTKASEYAAYCLGLAAEGEATRKAIEKEDEFKQQLRRYEEIAADYEREEAARVAREETLQTEQGLVTTELTEVHAKIASIRRVEATALEVLGEATYENREKLRQAALDEVNQAMQIVAQKKMLLTRVDDAALAELSPWSHLQAKYRPAEEYHDATTETMQRFIDLMNSLIGDDQGNHLAVLQTLPSIRNQYHNWRYLFTIMLDDLSTLSINQYHRNAIKPINLIRGRDNMLVLQSEYRKTR